MSTDVQKLTVVFQKAGDLVRGFVELVVLTALLWRLVGFQAVSGVALLIFLLAYFIGTWDVCVALHQQIRRWTDRRLRIIRGIVAGIRVIKMNAWEWLYEEKAHDMRRCVMPGRATRRVGVGAGGIDGGYHGGDDWSSGGGAVVFGAWGDVMIGVVVVVVVMVVAMLLFLVLRVM